MTKCYYEILGVDKNADEEDIRRVFKKLALKWHPDKNIDNQVEATERFLELQEAYECLSDAQRRTWYDSHREKLLSASNISTNKQSDFPNNFSNLDQFISKFVNPSLVDLWKFFHRSSFNSFLDSEPDGFYYVFNQVFHEIVKNESINDPEDPLTDAPEFGWSTSEWTNVTIFYNFWENFVARDGLCSATISRLLRDNGKLDMCRALKRNAIKQWCKLRRNQLKDYTENVRALVRVIKHRDPRITQHLILKAEIIEKSSIDMAEKKKQAEAVRKKNRENQRLHEAARWESIRETKRELSMREEGRVFEYSENEDDTQDNESVTESKRKLFCCKCCHKNFKSKNQYDVHLNSKKHRKAQKYCSEQCFSFNQVSHASSSSHDSASQSESEIDLSSRMSNLRCSEMPSAAPSAIILECCKEQSELKNDNESNICKNICSIDNTNYDNDCISNSCSSQEHEAEICYFPVCDVENSNYKYRKSRITRKRNNTQNKCDISCDMNSNNVTVHKIDNIENIKNNAKLNNIRNGNSNDKNEFHIKHIKNNNKKVHKRSDDAGNKVKCLTCGESFASRNALFHHLKITDHAVLKYTTGNQTRKNTVESTAKRR